MRGALAAALAVAIAPAGAGLRAQSSPGTVEARWGGRTAELRVAHHRAYPVVDGAELTAALLQDGVVAGSILRARAGARELVLQAGSPFFRFGDDTYQLANPPYEWGDAFWVPVELVTRWWPGAPGSDPPSSASAEGAPAGAGATAFRPERLDPDRPWRVVIDAGHGGQDPGTVGGRSREKEIALAIALAVKRELDEDPGFVPLLTRERDEFLRVRDRPRMAVAREGDLFISIHANSAPSRAAHGYETYFLGLARSEEARAVAMRENSAMELEEGHEPMASNDLQFILAGIDRNENLLESRRFAGFVQNALRGVRGPRGDRGVKQGPYWVLLGALTEMPSILVEVGFVTNAEEERVLRSREGQTRLARAIADAVVRYREDLVGRYRTARQSSR